jgi:glycosyltransferase involved in cell wall biosynthesis
MNIGLEATCLCNPSPTGIARYGKNLIYGLHKEISPINTHSLKTFFSLSQRKKFKYRNLNSNIDQKAYISSLWPFNKKVDLIHGLDSRVPLWSHCKKIVTIHDLFIHINTSEEMSPRKFREKKKRQLEDLMPSLDGIITVSQATKNDIEKLLNFPPEKTHVAHLGIEESFKPSSTKELKTFLQKYNLQETEYVLFIGAISGRKNTKRMVEAFAQSDLKKSMTFVLAGGLSYNGEDTRQKIIDLGMGDKIKILPFIESTDLSHLYSGAKALIFPTLYEGFGLPILEAMKCGIPVLTSTTGSAPEVSGGHAVLVNPYDIEDIKLGMEEIVTLNSQKREVARLYANSFTWKKTAENTIAAYSEII